MTRVSLASLAATLLCTVPAWAQVGPQIGPGQIFSPSNPPPQTREEPGPVGVLERQRPEVQPIGTHVGTFLVQPTATATGSYDSNIFAVPSGETGDFLMRFRPELTADNGPGLWQLRLNAYDEYVRYASNGDLSNNNFGASLTTIGDLPAFRVRSTTTFNYNHQDPSSLSLPVTGPLSHLPVYMLGSEDLSVSRDVARIGLTVNAGIAREDYENAIVSGVLVTESQLNNLNYYIGPKVSYILTPQTRPYVEARFIRHDYDNPGFNSNQYTLTTGADFELRRLFRGNAFVGYSIRDYDTNTTVSTTHVSSFTYGLNLQWYPTELMTVTATGAQSFGDTTVTAGTGVFSVRDSRTVQGQVDYEVLRQFIVSGVVAYENDDYNGTTRTDDIFTLGPSFTYLLNRHLSVLGQYRFLTRSSTQAGFNYDRHVIGIGLRFQY